VPILVADPGEAAVSTKPWGTSQVLAASGLFRVATDGNTTVVADWKWESGTGRVLVFEWDGAQWVRVQTLISPDPPPTTGGDGFGSAVDVRDGVIVVGQRHPHRAGGVVHVFEYRNGKWRKADRLAAPNGEAVAVWGDAIAACGDTPPAYDGAAGSVLLYEGTAGGWAHTQTLRRGQDGEVGCRFGSALDIWEDRLVVGDYYSHDPCTAYVTVYERSGGLWGRMQRLRGMFRGAGYETSVAIWGDTIAAGDPDPPPILGDATVHLFEWDGTRWQRAQRVRRATDFFGTAVALHQNTLVVGDSVQEKTWVFTRVDGTWRFARSLHPAGTGMGRYVAVRGGHVLTSSAGRAVAYRLWRCDGLVPTKVGTAAADLLIGTPRPDVVYAGAGDDLIILGDGNDVACAGPGADVVRGDDGNDLLFGAGGDDLLIGRAGADILIGGPGNDEGRGGTGADTCDVEVPVNC